MNEVSLTFFKKCSKCEVGYPRSLQFFSRSSRTEDGWRCHCKSCVSIYNREYRKQNAEAIAADQRRYREENAERKKELSRAWYQRNSDLVKAKTAAHKAEHKEKHKRYAEKARKKHWLKRKLREANRRAAKRGGSAPFMPCDDPATLWAMYEDQDGLCAYCETPLFGKFHIDHMLPLSRGGPHEWLNFALACATCNLEKQDKTPEEFMELGKKIRGGKRKGKS